MRPIISEAEKVAPNSHDHIKSGRSAAAVKGTFWSAVNQIVPVAMNSAVFIVSSRFLTPNDFGIVALSLSIVMFATALAPAAFGEAIVQLLKVRDSHLDSVFWMCTGFALSLYLIILGFSQPIAHLSGHIAIQKYLPVLGLRLFFDLGAVVPTALIGRAMAFHLMALRTTFATLASCVVCIVLLALGYGIWALVTSQVAVSVALCIGAFVGARWRPGARFSLEALGELSRYGLFASGNRFLQFMNLDQIFIGSLLGTTALGIFNFARRLYQMLSDVIAGALGGVAYALFSSLQSEPEKTREAFLFVTFGASIICFPAFMGLGAVAPTAIPFIFGPQWIEAVAPTRWFCLIGLLSCLGVIQSSLINSQGKTNWWFYYQLFKQVVMIGSIIVLRKASLVNIVMAIAIQYIVFWPVSVMMVKRLLNLDLTAYFRQFLAPFCASLVMLAAVLSVASRTQDIPAVFRLAIDLLVGCTVYGGLIFVLARGRIAVAANLFLKRGR